jgi:predicted MPP superfamily phosphohydrolase
MKCKCCNREKDLRGGFCFDCANAESIIVEGVDMWDNEIPKIEGLSTSLSKLQYILKKFGITKNE